MKAPIDIVLSHLEGVKSTRNGFNARCPAHPDKTPSLSVKEGDDGRVLLHCFAGCTTEAVVTSIGLNMTDLFMSRSAVGIKSNVAGVNIRELKAAISIERQILYFLKADQAIGKKISKSDWDRAKLALQRISLARRIL